MKKIIYLLICIVIFSACSEDAKDAKPVRTSKITNEQLVFDQQFKCYVPESFYSSPFVAVLDDKSESNNGRTESLTPGGGISATSTAIKYRNDAPGGFLQREYSCPTGAVVTGLGLLFATNGGYVQDMLAQYQYIGEDGVLQPTKYRQYAASSRPTPEWQLEAWIDLPPGALATGIGLIGKYDVQRMELWYRYYNSTTRRYNTGENVKVAGIAQGLPVQILYKLSDDINLEGRSAFTGLGFGNDGGGVRIMKFEIGYSLP